MVMYWKHFYSKAQKPLRCMSFVSYSDSCKPIVNYPSYLLVHLAGGGIQGTKFDLLYICFGLFKGQIFGTEFQ